MSHLTNQAQICLADEHLHLVMYQRISSVILTWHLSCEVNMFFSPPCVAWINEYMHECNRGLGAAGGCTVCVHVCCMREEVYHTYSTHTICPTWWQPCECVCLCHCLMCTYVNLQYEDVWGRVSTYIDEHTCVSWFWWQRWFRQARHICPTHHTCYLTVLVSCAGYLQNSEMVISFGGHVFLLFFLARYLNSSCYT